MVFSLFGLTKELSPFCEVAAMYILDWNSVIPRVSSSCPNTSCSRQGWCHVFLLDSVLSQGSRDCPIIHMTRYPCVL